MVYYKDLISTLLLKFDQIWKLELIKTVIQNQIFMYLAFDGILASYRKKMMLQLTYLGGNRIKKQSW